MGKTEMLISNGIKNLKKNYYTKLPRTGIRPKLQSSLDIAWNQYAGALFTAINGGNTWENLQLVALAGLDQKLNWDDPDFGDYYFHKVTADLINSPGASYGKTTNSFSERYGAFIQDISVPPVDPIALSQAMLALTDYVNDETRHTDLIYNLNIEWRAFDVRQRNNLPSSLWVGYDDWWVQNGAKPYDMSLQVNLAYFQKFENLIQKAYNGGQNLDQILSAYGPSAKVKVKVPTNSTNSQVSGMAEIFPYQISDSYPNWLAGAKSGLLQKAVINVNKNSSTIDITNTTIAGGIGFGFGFFGGLLGGSRTTTQINTQSQNFSLQLEGVFNTFNILPGAWYSSNAFGLYKDGPFQPNSPTEHLYETSGLFGPKGFLSFEPLQAIVVYNPKLTVTFDSSDYHLFDQVTQGFTVFCIGPFVVGGGYYYDHQTSVTRDDDNFTFTIEIKDYAVLIGFNSQPI